MNKQELAAKINEKAGYRGTKVVDTFTKAITEALMAGEKVQILGFGTFEVRERAARRGRNPKTGEEIVIPATKTAVFKSGKLLKKTINK